MQGSAQKRALTIRTRRLVDAYLDAREHVESAGFAGELDWQDTRDITRLTESAFLCEAAWVVLSAGLGERVVRGVFAPVSNAFLRWESAAEIARHSDRCIDEALEAFRHRPKLNAIAAIAREVDRSGFSSFMGAVLREGVAHLVRLAFIGPVTCFHLAKNIGMDVVKPDRHLVRLAATTGFKSAHDLCVEIAGVTGDRLATVDLVLWRYATIDVDYLEIFSRASR